MFRRPVCLFGAFLITATPVAGHAAVQAVHGSFIGGLFNTGIDVNRDGVDDHYQLRSRVSNTAYVGNGIAGSWISNGSSGASRWITPSPNALQSYDALSEGLYEYSLSFDLSGYRSETARFSGRWANDNYGEVRLNGQTLGISDDFTRWTSFAALSGFNSGLNTLTFSVTNYRQLTGNPTGLRVEFLSSVVSPVPEPSEWLSLAAGLGLVGLRFRKRSGVRIV